MTTLTTRRTGAVLIVDDDERVRDTVRRMLRKMRHSVLCAEDGQSALQAVASEHVEVIVLDMMMPGMNGEEFLDALADTHPELVAKVIVVSGQPPEGSEEYAMALGVHDYLAKPYNMLVLDQKVQQVLEVGALREAAGKAESGRAETCRSDEPAPHTRLTRRQLEVLIGVAARSSASRASFSVAVSGG